MCRSADITDETVPDKYVGYMLAYYFYQTCMIAQFS